MNLEMAVSTVVSTYLNANLRGHTVRLDWDSHPALARSKGTSFTTMTTEGLRQFSDVNDWISALQDCGFESAYLWLEDVSGKMGTASLAFVGGGRAAPVTRADDVEVIWQTWRVDDAPNIRGFQVMPGQQSITATPDAALRHMVNSLSAQRELASTESHTQDWAKFFGRAENEGRRMLVGEAVEIHPNAESLFPPGIYPRRSIELAYLVGSSWALGGMGTWNDVAFDDPASNDQLNKLRRDYYLAACECMYAACDVAV